MVPGRDNVRFGLKMGRNVPPRVGVRPGRRCARVLRGIGLWGLLLAGAVCAGVAADALPAGSPAESGQDVRAPTLLPPDSTNSQQLFEAMMRIETHLRAHQAILDQNRRDAMDAAARNAELLSNGLQVIGNAFSMQQAVFAARNMKEFEALHTSNRLMRILAGSFAGFATVAITIMAWFQWRMSKAWAAISAALPAARSLGAGSAFPALGSAEDASAPTQAADESNMRLLGAIEQLDRRVQQMEAANSNLAAQPDTLTRQTSDNGNGNGNAAAMPGPAAVDNGRITSLLEQGQNWLRKDELESALACFDQVLSLEPKHGEALVKKGAVLERLQRLNEAFECYDRAIAADSSMTIAYLHKGGLCSRLERFKEALECYEKALRTHTEWRS